MCISHANKSIQSLYPKHSPLSRSQATFFLYELPHSQVKTFRHSPYIPESTEIIQTCQSWTCQTLPCLSCESYNKDSFSLFFLLFCLLPDSGVLPHGPVWHGKALALGAVRNKLCLQWQLYSDLLAWLYLNNKIHLLK